MNNTTTVNSKSYVVLGIKEKIGYGLGDFASNLSFGFVSLFLLYFYTDIYKITGTQASLIFVIARVVDAIFNIVIGYFVDQTNTRYGKLRPYLLFGAIPLGILTVLCFIVFETEYKFYFALISYTLYCLAYTAVNTPYSAMTNMMTQHEGSRASLSVYRFVLATLGYFVVSTSAEKIIALFTEPTMGYTFAVSCFALFATFAFLFCFGMTKERVIVEKDVAKPKLNEMFKAIYTNKPLINLSIFTTFFYIAYILWMAIAVYYINYTIGDEGFATTFFAIHSVAYILGTIASEKLVGPMGKKNLTILALIIGTIGCGAQYYMTGLFAIMSCVCLYGITLGMGFVTMWSMIADTVEYSEWKNNTRTEGAIYGFFNFVTKIAMAIGGGISGLLLDYYGYSADNVTPEAINGINVMMTIIPASMFAISIIFIVLYTLDEKTYRNIINEIEKRKATNA